MAIIKCPNCKNSMSSNDKSCPHCGSKYEPEFCCPQCNSKDLTFTVESGEILPTSNQKAAKAGAVALGQLGQVPVMGALLLPALGVAAASSTNTEITYVCKQCGCKFTRRNQTSNEGASSQIHTQIYEAPKPQKYNLITAYISLLKKAFQFRGRSRRREYWLSYLAFYLLNLLCVVLTIFTQSEALYFAVILAAALHVIPFLSMTVRRLHDSGKSGGCLLFNMIPFVGSIIVFVMLLQDSDYGDNKYGPNPKGLS